MGSPLLEVTQRPAVYLVAAGRVSEDYLRAIETGLEEEGIPSERRESSSKDPVPAASEAARASRINVAVALSTEPPGAVLHHRDLPEQNPLFRLSGGEVSLGALQRLGRNAARLVKGNPFIFGTLEKEKQ